MVVAADGSRLLLVVDDVSQFNQSYPNPKLVVTLRTLKKENPSKRPKEVEEFHLRGLEKPQRICLISEQSYLAVGYS